MIRRLNWTAETLCVFIDICSSTSIVERCCDLGIEDNWGSLILDLSDFIDTFKVELYMNSHKFLGDGWILFINPNIKWTILFSFFEKLASKYIELYNKYIHGNMVTELNDIGLTIGLHTGTLFAIRNELFGMPLNIASRLQGSLRRRGAGTSYANKVMILKELYESQPEDLSEHYSLNNVEICLRNLREDTPQQCVEISLF